MLHVMLDLYGCNPELLADEVFLWQVLDEYPDLIGMQKVSPIELRYIVTSNPLDAGYSGFVIIATSHVSLHVWPAYKMVNMDIFSCEHFDQESVVRFATMKFQSEDVEVHVVERATRSPRLALPLRQSSNDPACLPPVSSTERDPAWEAGNRLDCVSGEMKGRIESISMPPGVYL